MIIDIILLTYNNVENTKQCINNLYKFTDNFGLVILDNHSTDGTVDYLKKISDQNDNITLFLSDLNLGIINGRNSAYKLSKGTDYIVFLDNDQYDQKDWLDSYLKLMIDKEFDLIGCEAWKMREKDFYPYKKIIDNNDTFSYVGAGGLMIKNKIFEKLGLFDEDYDFIYFEDPSLCFKAHYQGYKIGWNYNPIIDHNHKGALLSNENRKYFLNNWKVFQNKWQGKRIPIFSNTVEK